MSRGSDCAASAAVVHVSVGSNGWCVALKRLGNTDGATLSIFNTSVSLAWTDV